jgi:hypothetical protein
MITPTVSISPRISVTQIQITTMIPALDAKSGNTPPPSSPSARSQRAVPPLDLPYIPDGILATKKYTTVREWLTKVDTMIIKGSGLDNDQYCPYLTKPNSSSNTASDASSRTGSIQALADKIVESSPESIE